MTLLLVEDDENKRNQLSQFLREQFPELELVVQRSLQSGLRSIRYSRPKCVLFDMTLPNYDTGPEEPGGKMHIFGGREFLRQMDRFGIAVPVIVVTQFETFGKARSSIGLAELDRELRQEHPSLYLGSVYYNAAISGWKDDLRKLITHIVA